MTSNDLAIGIDIGGTNTSIGIVDAAGNILERNGLKTKPYATFQEFVDALVQKVNIMLYRFSNAQFIGVGVGAPNGNFYTGQIVDAANLPWKGVLPLADLLHQALQLKVVVTNDANAAALGEKQYGVARGKNDFIMVTLGTGIGSGFVTNGQLIYGHDGFAGELGHTIAIRNGRQCGCGRKGCLETYASASGIVRTAEEWMKEQDVTSILTQQSEPLTSYSIQQAAKAGDEFAIQVFEFTGKILGQSLADAVAITSPELIVLFGGLAKSGSLLIEPTKLAMEENLLSIYKNKIPILHSAFEEGDAAILGAAALVY